MGAAETYEAFVEKFKPKKTTDDCYTPPIVYDAVADWVAQEYGVDRSRFVRPFWPGANFLTYDYRPDDIIVDNPPFSILTQITRTLVEAGRKFFLFAPSLTLFSPAACCTAVCTMTEITYENGAKVRPSFVTNMEPGSCIVRTAPTLSKSVSAANEENQKKGKVSLPKYVYPDHIITAAMVGRWSNYGVEFRLKREDAVRVPALASQREQGKAIFGSGYLLSERAAAERAAAERAAAERAAAERAAAERWTLSEAEWDMVRSLGGDQSQVSLFDEAR